MHLSMLSPRGGGTGNNRGFEFLLYYFVKCSVLEKLFLVKTSQNAHVLTVPSVQMTQVYVADTLSNH